MKRTLTASVVRDGEWYVAQCLEAAIASQGETLEEALANLREPWNSTSSRPAPPRSPMSAPSRSSLAPLRPLPHREVKRTAAAAGFAKVGQKGNHVKLAKTTTAGVLTATVPRHRDIALGTLRNVRRQARLGEGPALGRR